MSDPDVFDPPDAPDHDPSPRPSPSPGPDHDLDQDLEQGPGVEAEGGEPVPLGVERAPTGNAEVDSWLDRLTDVDALPTENHFEVYEDVHRGLRDALTALDSRPGPPGPVPAAPRTTYDDRR